MRKLDGLIKKYRSGEVVLLDLLEEIADEDRCVSLKKLEYLSEKLNIPLAKLYATASYYSFLPTTPQGKYVLRICNSPSCYMKGSKNLITFLKEELKIGLSETTKDGKFTLKKTQCLGCCDKAPAMMINDKLYCELTETKLRKILRSLK